MWQLKIPCALAAENLQLFFKQTGRTREIQKKVACHDKLKVDAAIIEKSEVEMVLSHQVKRFFKMFTKKGDDHETLN